MPANVNPARQSVNAATLNTYLNGWTMICNSTPQSVEAMLASAHPDIRFSDVNSTNVHLGHEGIRTICRLATQIYQGATITYCNLLFDGRHWAIRWTLAGTWPDGKSFNFLGASAGTVADDGRVIEHTDYWNRGAPQAEN